MHFTYGLGFYGGATNCTRAVSCFGACARQQRPMRRTSRQHVYMLMHDSYVGIIYLMLMKASSPPLASNSCSAQFHSPAQHPPFSATYPFRSRCSNFRVSPAVIFASGRSISAEKFVARANAIHFALTCSVSRMSSPRHCFLRCV
jgi:hypothetical protein